MTPKKQIDPKAFTASVKPPMHLVPPVAIVQEAMSLRHGAEKYGEFNWRSTDVNMTTYLSAALRHLAALQDGEDMDRDSGIHHAAHVRASMAILLDAKACGRLVDDRPLAGGGAEALQRFTVGRKPETPAPKPVEKSATAPRRPMFWNADIAAFVIGMQAGIILTALTLCLIFIWTTK